MRFLLATLLALSCAGAIPLRSSDPPGSHSCPVVPVQQSDSLDYLTLSGGGYRAMLFHLGALWRLNELGVMKSLERIASVSGGSITAGVLAQAWPDLQFEKARAIDFEEKVAAPILRLADETIDWQAILWGALTPSSASDRIAATYRRVLFGESTTKDLTDGPEFIFTATNLQTGATWRFTRLYAGDPVVGFVPNPKIDLATAIAASSAFPPFLSPVVLRLDADRPTCAWPWRAPNLDVTPALVDGSWDSKKVVLSDGGIADNLGVDVSWKAMGTLYVSDASAAFAPSAEIGTNWYSQMRRTIEIIHNQPSSFRMHTIRNPEFQESERKVVVWTIRGGDESGEASTSEGESRSELDVARASAVPAGPNEHLPTSKEDVAVLSAVSTRLKRLDRCTQQRLVNWGYTAAANAIDNARVATVRDAPPRLPYPCTGLGPATAFKSSDCKRPAPREKACAR